MIALQDLKPLEEPYACMGDARSRVRRLTLHQVLKFSIFLPRLPPFLPSGAHSLMPFNAIYNSLTLQAVHKTRLSHSKVAERVVEYSNRKKIKRLVPSENGGGSSSV